MKENAITRRIDKLQSIWDSFREFPEARCCCWLVQQDEQSLVDAFFQVNAAEHSDTPDIFLRFESPFSSAAAYSTALSEELSEMVEGDREALEADDIHISWKYVPQKASTENTGVNFLRNLFHFGVSLDLDDDSYLVAFIAPPVFSDRKGWEKWWRDVLSLDIPSKVRLMVCDVAGFETVSTLQKQFHTKLAVYKPQLDAPGAMRELMTEYGDQDDNCTHFRKAYFELTQKVGQRDMAGIKQTAKTALDLARTIGFPHLEVSVLCTAATGFVSGGQLETGMSTYDEARRIAKVAEPLPLIKEMPELNVELPGGNIFAQLGIQVLFFKGAGLIGAGLFDRALKVYQEAEKELSAVLIGKGDPKKADWMNGGILVFHRIEALRMSGYCLERLGRKQEALQPYSVAVSMAERLDAETRKSTTVAFVGKSMLDICSEQSMKNEFLKVTEKMNALLGKGWEDTLPKKA